MLTVSALLNDSPASLMKINPATADEYGFLEKKFAILCFGSKRHRIFITLAEEAQPGEILLSPDIISYFSLPDYINFELRVKGNEIILGPFIGILVSKHDQKITPARLQRLLKYTLDYPRLHGVLLVFALDKVDPKTGLLEGYCYNPKKHSWQKEVLPYPAALYRRIGLNSYWQEHFTAVLGDRIFNNYFFDKWQTYQWLAIMPEIKPYLPFTILFQSPEDISAMLEKYGVIYVKPISGMQGKGVFRLEAKADKICIRFREYGENRELAVTQPGEASELLDSLLRPSRFLIQESVKLLTNKERITDFRVILQKNQNKQWICQGIIGRTGAPSSIVSNVSSDGQAFLSDAILKELLAAKPMELFAIKEKLASLALAICQALDEIGINCGTLGLDLGLDQDGKLWLIEINNRDPDPTIALDAGDKQLYYKILTTPLFYAKALAGFEQ